MLVPEAPQIVSWCCCDADTWGPSRDADKASISCSRNFGGSYQAAGLRWSCHRLKAGPVFPAIKFSAVENRMRSAE